MTQLRSNVPSQLGGTSITIWPVPSVSAVFDRGPLRTLAGLVGGVPLMPEVLGHPPVQGGLDHDLGQLPRQPVRPGQGEALLPGPPDRVFGRHLLGRRLRLSLRHGL